MKYIIANWKANKQIYDVRSWIETFKTQYQVNSQVNIIICPPAVFINELKNGLNNLNNVFIGSQDVSIFEGGSFTGEITAKTYSGLILYAIIGHSERRKNFSETDLVLEKKFALAKQYQIEPIYCVRDQEDNLPAGVKYIAYEPVYAIGTGVSENPEKVIEMKSKINLPENNVFIYGGSVNEKNIADYVNTGAIDGFLIGAASLDPLKFVSIINKVK